jgi:hypothetical protein
MGAKPEYHSGVERLSSATVGAFALLLGMAAVLASAPGAGAQINGTPASVSSINSGGHLNSTPGVPASITSLGPNGLEARRPFSNPPPCCINPLLPANPNPPLFRRDHHHHSGQFFPLGGPVYLPYAVPYELATEPEAEPTAEAERAQAEQHRGGPTIFDRRGSAEAVGSDRDWYRERSSRLGPAEEASAAAPGADTSAADQPQTVLIFKDGRQREVQNYAVVGDVLYDLTPGSRHKIALTDLDLPATAKQNEERGIDFQLPPKTETKTETKTEMDK